MTARDKTITRAGAKKPDLSHLTDGQLRASIRTMADEVRERHSILDYCRRELKRREKASKREQEAA